MCRYLDKNGVIPKYNLQYLRYYLGLEIEAKAHDALGDILVLEGLFSRLNAKFQENGKLMDPVQEMIHISSNPVLIARMPYGKHKGVLFSEVPRDYLDWLPAVRAFPYWADQETPALISGFGVRWTANLYQCHSQKKHGQICQFVAIGGKCRGK